jgi:hypothetical protein
MNKLTKDFLNSLTKSEVIKYFEEYMIRMNNTVDTLKHENSELTSLILCMKNNKRSE